jgi:hypothetical protein
VLYVQRSRAKFKLGKDLIYCIESIFCSRHYPPPYEHGYVSIFLNLEDI